MLPEAVNRLVEALLKIPPHLQLVPAEPLPRLPDAPLNVQLEFIVEEIRHSLRMLQLEVWVELLLYAVHGELSPASLAAWLIQSGLQARLQLQLQKYLWPGQHRGV